MRPIVKWRLRRQETSRGEWSVLDPRRGYRICRYHHDRYGGTHIHFPENGPVLATVEISKPQEAELLMRRYHEKHDAFDLQKLQEVIKEWKSESVGD